MKNSLKNQLYMIQFCIREIPGMFWFHVIACIEVEVFIFFEYTIWIGYNLDAAENGTSFRRVAVFSIGVILLFVLHQLFDSVYFFWSFDRMKPVLTQKLRSRIYEKAKQVDLACYDDTKYFNEFILSTNQADQCVERFLNDSQQALRYTVQILLQIGFFFAVDKFGMIFGIGCALLKYFFCRKYYKVSEELKLKMLPLEKEREYQHRVFYLHDYAKELRQNPEMGDLLEKDFEACNDRMKQLNRQYGFRLWILDVLKSYVPVYFLLFLIYLPYLLYRNLELQDLSLGVLVILFESVKRLVKRGNWLMELVPRISLNSTFIGKIRAFLELEPGIQSGEVPVEGALESLKLEKVSFSYERKGRPGEKESAAKKSAAKKSAEKESAAKKPVAEENGNILCDISMEIKKGQKIALVGYNGAGKTTLVKLLMRLYDPDRGRILRNGVDIRELQMEDYRKSIGAVFQDFKIYAATIRENVVMDQCTMEKQETYEVEEALYRAKFSLGDRKLKYQIETPLTTEFEKNGVNLSGGESQKVAIARTLYRKQDLIIMDEPSSALDPSAEYRLNQELKRIAEDKTVIFISHRLSTAYDADWIYMMKDGQIVEQGTHQDLLALGGEYSRMWKLQANAYH